MRGCRAGRRGGREGDAEPGGRGRRDAGTGTGDEADGGAGTGGGREGAGNLYLFPGFPPFG